MLYTTTRSSSDTYTAQRTLTLTRGSDGGFFIPFHLPVFSQSEIAEFGSICFNERLSLVLNLLFGTRLTSYDIDLAIGRHSVRLSQLGQRLIVAECWHNTQWHFSRMVNDLSALMNKTMDQEPQTGSWAEVGIRIAVLFGIFGELLRDGTASAEKTVDISVVSGNFSAPMSAWYARKMGLPIGNIVCCCNENGGLWDFFCHGSLRTDAVATDTFIPEADVAVPMLLECLIHAYGGTQEVMRYMGCCHRGGSYYVDEGMLMQLRKGFYATVSSGQRVISTISNCKSTHQYLFSLPSALAYSGLQDYRGRTGASATALIFAEKSPKLDMHLYSDGMEAP